jgi:2,3-bisphosphoglycerate-independent phosphoglycerate mutase
VRCILVILDGLADEPCPDLGGRTPLEAACTPNLDCLAGSGRLGRFLPTAPGRAPGSEGGVPACLGVAPGPLPPARARLEAAGRGIPVGADDAVYRVTCVHLSGPADDPDPRLRAVADPDAGFDAVRNLAPGFAQRGVRLHPDPGGRHLAVLPGQAAVETVPPHDLARLPLSAGGPLPRPDAWAWARRALPGDLALWPWGGAGIALLGGPTPFEALITGVDLVRGIGRVLGLAVPAVAGATGGADSDFGAKARAALAIARHGGNVAVHVEAPDMAAHGRDPRAKAAVLARIDRDLFGPLLDGPDGLRVAVVADHGTSSRTGRHLDGPVPYLVAELPAGAGDGAFCEAAVGDLAAIGVEKWRALLAREAVPC